MRYDDQFVVRIGSETTEEVTIDTLTGPGGPMFGYDVSRSINSDTLVLSMDAKRDFVGPIAAVDLTAVRQISNIDWATPLFADAGKGGWIAVNDEIIVALKPGVTPEEFFGDEIRSWRRLSGTPDQFVATLSEGAGLEFLDLANRLHFDPRVQWASINFYSDVQLAFTPSDALFEDQWHLHNTGQTDAQSDADSDLPRAWDVSQGSSDVVIAVLDDGVQTNHPDLNIWVNSGETASNSTDDDGNGWVDDINGWNFVQGSLGDEDDPNPVDDDDNHGTAVAGVAAAAGNSTGVSGASRNAKIMPLKIFEDGVFAGWDQAAEALYYAAGRTEDGMDTWDAADVINMSFGGPITSHAAFDAAVDWAESSGREGDGASMFAATGNNAAGTQQGLNYATQTFNVQTAGDWDFRWAYVKNGSGSAGEDRGWLANFTLPDDTTERFDTTGLPTGWSTFGDACWAVVDDPGHSYGTGRYVARAGAIGNGEITYLQSPTITVPGGGGELSYSYWVSSESGADGLVLLASYEGGSYNQQWSFSGVPNITSDVTYPANPVVSSWLKKPRGFQHF